MAEVTDAPASAPPPDDHRHLLERMLTEQPQRLPKRMLRAVRDRDLAEDLSQETLTRALTSLATLRGPAEEALVCGWLETIAANVVRSHARRSSRSPLAVDWQDLPDTADPLSDSRPDQVVTDAETRQALAGLIAALPEHLAEVFVRRVIDEQSTAAVAQALAISDDLVRWRLRRARTLLRERIDASAG